jgi:hypothetical protein
LQGIDKEKYYQGNDDSSIKDDSNSEPQEAPKLTSAVNETDPTKALQLVLDELNGVVNNLRAEHGARLYVPANTTPMVEDKTHFDDAHQNPLAHAGIKGSKDEFGFSFDESEEEKPVEVTTEHIDATLKDSGFSQACLALQKTIQAGEEVTHEALTGTMMALANYLLGDTGKEIPPVVLNVYNAVRADIPVVEGLTTHSQSRKIRFDIAAWQVHIPAHTLAETSKLAGRLAKMAVDIAQAARSMQQMNMFSGMADKGGMIDPGSTSLAVVAELQPSAREQRAAMTGSMFDAMRRDDAAKESSGNVSKDLLSSLVGGSKTYTFRARNHTLRSSSFNGPQKPTKENHWHNFGDRALLKEMKNDLSQSPPNREHADLAYRAGVIARKEAEPMLAVRRAFALQANALAAQGAADEPSPVSSNP